MSGESRGPSDVEVSALAAMVRRAAVAPSPMSTRVIAIDGLGGAGKSALAGKLAPLLEAEVLCTDDFASADTPLEWWPRLIEQVLVPLSRNEPGRYQRYDWSKGRLAEWNDVAVAPFLVLEGVSSSRAAFAPYLAFRIWVETSRKERLRRGLERDGMDARELWRGWMAAEDAYVSAEHPERGADVVVSGETP